MKCRCSILRFPFFCQPVWTVRRGGDAGPFENREALEIEASNGIEGIKRHRDEYGESQAFELAGELLEGVDADDPSPAGHQGAAAIAGIDLRIGLHETPFKA